MKNFKQFYTEVQRKHSDLFNAMGARIKLDAEASRRIIGVLAGQSGTFRHMTNIDGAQFLINNKDKSVSVSAEKFTKTCHGIETSGEIVLILKANHVIWYPKDAWTYRGEGGVRWMDVQEAGRINEIMPEEFLKKLTQETIKIILQTDENLLKIIKDNYAFVSGDEGWYFYHDLFVGDGSLEVKISEYVEKNPKVGKVLLEKLLKLQKKLLLEYSEEIQKNIRELFKENVYKKRGIKEYYDEAVVNNIEVTHILVKERMNIFKGLLSELDNRDGDLEDQKDYIDSAVRGSKVRVGLNLGKFINNFNIKNIPITMVTKNCLIEPFKSIMKNPDRNWKKYFDIYIDHLGLKRMKPNSLNLIQKSRYKLK